ncbi:MAG: hypothetical protein GY943_29135 [Chloroflexi bacterium]|nr:hypothetical protein [Chloroflexota bacterium]
MSRMKFAPPSDVQNDFVQHLSSLLDIYQGHLQGKLWSHEETSETVHTSATNTPPHAGNDAPSQAGSPVPAQDTKPAPDDGDAERAAAPNNDAELDDDHETILPPIIPYLPIPGHKNENPDDYKWYIIEQQQKESNIFPSSVKKGAYVLVDTRSKRASDLAITHSRRVSERMIILSHEETTKQNGRITVKPAYITQGYPRIFLGLIDGSAQPQTQTDNIPVTLSKDLQKISIHIQAILGIVIGFWLPGDNPQNESQEPS